jgi:hypothetical protein
VRRGVRAWASVAAACVAFAAACGDGTAGWILRHEGARGTADGHDAARRDGGALDADAALASRGDAGALLGEPSAFRGVCSPDVTLDNRTASGNGALFDRTFPDPKAIVDETAQRVCATLYKAPAEVPQSPPIMLVIDDFYGIGEISITPSVVYIQLSSLRMQSTAAAGQSVRDDVVGALHYSLAIDYELHDENPAAVRWVTEGIAGYVRIRGGYTPISERAAGGGPMDDSKTTGFFLDWLDRTYPLAVYRLNQSLNPDDGVEWSQQVFHQITGKDLMTLWNDYQATL